MLTVLVWKWGTRFNARHVNTMRAMLERHLHIEHRVVCVTDDDAGIDPRVTVVPISTALAHTPRCQRRMEQFSRRFADDIGYAVSGEAFAGDRLLSIDLDMVLVDDITPLVDRPEPLVAWKVGHAQVFSGSFLLFDGGALDALWMLYLTDSAFPRQAWPRGIPSDQAMLNFYLRTQPPIPFWTDADGFVSYYGRGYERFEHLGVGPNRPDLPAGARIVVLGSDDLPLLDSGQFAWARDHWRINA